MNISYVPFEEIDKVKWNSCVHFAVNSEVSAYYWWLKAVVKEWDALVEGDYESVLPIFYKKDLWGRKSIVHPPLIGRIGIQSINLLSRKRIVSMLDKLPDIANSRMLFNEMNIIPPDFETHTEQKEAWRVLLNKSLTNIRSNYQPEVMNTISTDLPDGYFFQVKMKPEQIVEFAKENKQMPYDEFATLRVLYNLLHRGTLINTVILDNEQKPVAMLTFTYHLKKIKVLLSVQNEKGRELNAIHRMYDHVFNLHQNKPMMFEFYPGDGEFAKGLGGESYIYWELNRSDTLGNWSKRLEKATIF
ncbi:MAG: hypothetical protein EA411_00755 [Saprospirales bacterium]|nr:MAG: hypothetical protein EA411_00755 [Saprospirales bacterium]